jgi:hypothetical protein
MKATGLCHPPAHTGMSTAIMNQLSHHVSIDRIQRLRPAIGSTLDRENTLLLDRLAGSELGGGR